MRPLLFLLCLFLFPALHAQDAPGLKFMQKKSGQVLRVKIVEGLTNPQKAGPVLVEVEESYKSSKLRNGRQFAVFMQPFSVKADSTEISALAPGTELVLFLAKDKPLSYARGTNIFPMYHLFDEYSGWLFYRENFAVLLKK